MEKAYTSEQINRTKQLCELLNDIPDKKQEVISIAMLFPRSLINLNYAATARFN